MSEAQPIGQVSHYFGKLSVAAIELFDTMRVGDEVHFYGSGTNFVQQITSMQVEHNPVEEAYAEQSVGVLVEQRVRASDHVYLVEPSE